MRKIEAQISMAIQARYPFRGGNTEVFIDSQTGEVRVRFHTTDIFTMTAGKIRLSSGGWRTSTTKNRLNTCLNAICSPWRIGPTKFEWYVRRIVTADDRYSDDKWITIPFEDGMYL